MSNTILILLFSILLISISCSSTQGESPDTSQNDSELKISISKIMNLSNPINVVDLSANIKPANHNGQLVTLKATVTSVDIIAKSPSIVSESSSISLSVLTGSVPCHPSMNKIQIFFDPDSTFLQPKKIKIGDRWTLTFTTTGDFYDLSDK